MDNMKTQIEQIRQRKIDELTQKAWDYAHAILWQKHPFSEKEVKEAKKQIRKYFEAIPLEIFFIAYSDLFLEFCTRIILTREYIERKPGRYVTHPAVWFSSENKFGFPGTKRWFNNLLDKFLYESVQFHFENGKIVAKVA
ncbi:MAG: hypothetical protein ACOZCO_05150 [Bacteroidota bacterium]